MDCGLSLPIRYALQRRPHVTRRPMQGVVIRPMAARSSGVVTECPTQVSCSESSDLLPFSTSYFHDETSTASTSLLSISSMESELPAAILPAYSHSNSPKPNIDVRAWVDNTNLHTCPSRSDSTGQGILAEIPAPWMQLPQQELFRDVHRTPYRETALYSEPGSLSLSRAYNTDEPQFVGSRISNASWETFGLCGNLRDSESVVSHGKATSEIESSDFSSDNGNATWPEKESFSSGLSIKCQGEHSIDPQSMKDRPVLALVSKRSGRRDNFNFPFSDWSEDGDSDGCSSCCSEYAHEELATPLAPARAHVVHISTEGHSQSQRRNAFLPQRDSVSPSLASAPSGKVIALDTLPGSQESISTPLRHTSSSHTDSISKHLPEHSNDTAANSSPDLTSQYSVANSRFVEIKPSIALIVSNNSVGCRATQGQAHDSSAEGLEKSSEIMSGIRAAITNSSMEVLSLQTPCVVEIRIAGRRHNAGYRRLSGSSSSSSLSPSEEQDSVPPLRLNLNTPSLSYSSEADSRDAEDGSTWSQDGLSTETSFSSADNLPEYSWDKVQLPEPDLGPLSRIFPRADEWWCNILYAHMVTYNYITDLEEGPSFQRRRISADGSKSLQSLESGIYRKTMKDLQSCISLIIWCMSGNVTTIGDKETGDSLRESKLAIVRALAKLVRSCEASTM